MASSRKSRGPSPNSDSEHPPPPRRRGRHPDDDSDPPRKRRPRSRYDPGYSMPREKFNKVDLLFCVFRSSNATSWKTVPYSFDRRKIDDRELWEDIRAIYRDEMERPWRRIVLFKRLKLIAPIEYTRNDVPVRKDAKDLPDKHSYLHAYHHPDRIRPDHEWVDFFVQLRSDPSKSYGLEFVEGLWAEKLAAVAVLITIAIIIVSIVWCIKGGQLQTVFTVMGFVLTGAAAEVALVALYYQVTLPG